MTIPTIKGSTTTAVDTNGVAAGGTQAVTKPSGAAANDIYLVFSSAYRSGGIPAAVTSTGLTSLVSYGQTSTYPTRMEILAREYDGSEGGSFTVTQPTNATDYWTLGSFVIQNADTAGTITQALHVSNTGTGSGSSTAAAVQATTSVANCGIFLFVIAIDTTISSTTLTGGWTEIASFDSNFVKVFYKSQASAGATGTPTITFAASTGWLQAVLAFDEGASGTDATATPATIAATTSLDAVTATGGSSGTPAPATIIAPASLDAAVVSVGSVMTPAAIAATATLPAPTGAAIYARFMTDVAASGRYFRDQNGDPWLGVGEAAWSLIAQLDDADIATYLDNRAAKGINFVMFNAPERFFATNAPNNIDNVAPFTGTAFQSTLNDTYWDRVDYTVAYAEALGITCYISPLYLGYPSTSQGWATEVAAASNAQITTYGEALATRYGSAPNVQWIIVGDRTPNATEKARGNALADALQANTSQMVTAVGHSDIEADGVGSNEWTGSGVTFDYDTLYHYGEQVAEVSYDMWANSPTLAFGFFEGKFEQEQSPETTEVELREQYWAAWAAGATYVFFGNNPIWHFESGLELFSFTGTWQSNMDAVGSDDLSTFAAITAAIGDGWATTNADTGSTFVTTQGTGSDRVAARFDGNLGIVYHPNFTSGTITLDLTEFATNWTTVTVTRYDVVSAATTTVGTYATSGTQNLSAPSANSAGDNDWLYVVTGATANDTATPAALAATASLPAPSASGTSNATPTPAAIIAGVTIDAATASGTSNATPTPATVAVIAALDAATAWGGTNADATPAEIIATAALDAVTATGTSNATPAPDAIIVPVSFDAASASGSGSATPTPAAIIATAAVDAVSPAAGSTVTITEIVALASFDATAASGGTNATPTPNAIVAVVTVDAPAYTASGTATPASLEVLVVLPAVFTIGNGVFAPGSIVVVIRRQDRTLDVEAVSRVVAVPARSRTLEVTDAD